VTETRAENAVRSIEIAGSIGFFANAVGLPPRLDEEQIATVAATAIAARMGRPLPVLYARQVHGALTYTYGAEGPLPAGPRLVGSCDALITGEVGVALLIRTADCLPVVLAGPGVAAVVHAGWRGLAADVLGAAVRRIAAEFGVSASHLTALCGVGIGPCHYVVGDDVIRALSARPSQASGWHAEGRVDLRAWALGRLLTLGLAAGNLSSLEGCTACDPNYHSFRRDRERAGRQWSAVVVTDEAG